MSKIMKLFCKSFDIEKIESTAYHPQSLGSLKRSHQDLIQYLRQFSNAQSWDEKLRFALFSYNTSIHESTGFAPYTLVFGKEAVIPSSFPQELPDKTYQQYLQEIFHKLDNVQSLAREILEKSKRTNKLYYDKNVHPVNYKVNDIVNIKINIRNDKKFDPFFKGPYKIIELIGEFNVKIKKISNNKIRIVHRDQLQLTDL